MSSESLPPSLEPDWLHSTGFVVVGRRVLHQNNILSLQGRSWNIKISATTTMTSSECPCPVKFHAQGIIVLFVAAIAGYVVVGLRFSWWDFYSNNINIIRSEDSTATRLSRGHNSRMWQRTRIYGWIGIKGLALAGWSFHQRTVVGRNCIVVTHYIGTNRWHWSIMPANRLFVLWSSLMDVMRDM